MVTSYKTIFFQKMDKIENRMIPQLNYFSKEMDLTNILKNEKAKKNYSEMNREELISEVARLIGPTMITNGLGLKTTISKEVALDHFKRLERLISFKRLTFEPTLTQMAINHKQKFMDYLKK
jgi:hypothetical protein